MRILDIHGHLGYDCINDAEITKEQLLHYYRKYQISGAIVQPCVCRPYLEANRNIHNEIHKLCKDPDTGIPIWGMANIWPHFTRSDYRDEAQRCIRELGFVGIKMNTRETAVNPRTMDGMYVCEVAYELGVPLMIHTCAGLPFADPMNLLPAVRRFPKLKFILAHSGVYVTPGVVIDLAKESENIFLETTWAGVNAAEKFLKALGSTRLLFAADQGMNIPVELSKYESLALSQGDMENILYKNALEIYQISI